MKEAEASQATFRPNPTLVGNPVLVQMIAQTVLIHDKVVPGVSEGSTGRQATLYYDPQTGQYLARQDVGLNVDDLIDENHRLNQVCDELTAKTQKLTPVEMLMYRVCEALDAKSDLLSIIGSYKDCQDVKETAMHLVEWLES
jgi:hypothetical protein